jgi:hypothetical protein
MWHAKSLGDGMTASLYFEEIETVFNPLFASAGKPADMAVFTRSESEGRLHCEVIAYFSPAAIEAAKALNAIPCARPIRAGLELIAGDKLCWSILFPENN